MAVEIPNPVIADFAAKYRMWRKYNQALSWEERMKELEAQFVERKEALEKERQALIVEESERLETDDSLSLTGSMYSMKAITAVKVSS